MSSKAEKLLQNMRVSKANCTLGDLYAIYGAFGFKMRIGKKHDTVEHPRYTWLKATLPRKHTTGIALGYFDHAVKTIDELRRLESGGKKYDKQNRR